jgi:hypothetical protein
MGALRNKKTPIITGDHPEQDETPLLDNEHCRQGPPVEIGPSVVRITSRKPSRGLRD